MRRHGIPLCPGRGTSAYAVNEASPFPIGLGALQAPGHPRAAAAALLRCWWRGPGPAALVIGTAVVTTVLPEIPPETLAEWQRAVDLTARLARVPASLIMRTERPTHTVLVSSRTEGNPYDVGREYDLNALLYCQGVFDNDGELVVEDATHDPVWAGNEDLADGMRFYIGYPLKWPSGEVFGTICVLDRARNDHGRWCADAGRPTRFKPSSPSPTGGMCGGEGTAMCGEPRVAAECTCTEREFGRCSRRPSCQVARLHGRGTRQRRRECDGRDAAGARGRGSWPTAPMIPTWPG